MRATFPNVLTQTPQPANCDGDAQIVGGGGSISGPAPQSTLNETYPIPPSTWQAEGNSTGAVQKLKAYAVCGGFIPEYENNQAALGENTVLIATAPCAMDTDPIGGGGGATGSGIRMIASFPRLPPSSPLGWHPFAHNTTMDDTLWDSWAICSDLDVSYRNSSRVRIGPEEDRQDDRQVHVQGGRRLGRLVRETRERGRLHHASADDEALGLQGRREQGARRRLARQGPEPSHAGH